MSPPQNVRYLVLARSYAEAAEWAFSQKLPPKDGREWSVGSAFGWMYVSDARSLRGLRDWTVKILPGFNRRHNRDEIRQMVEELAARGLLRIEGETPKPIDQPLALDVSLEKARALHRVVTYPSLALANVSVALNPRNAVLETVTYESRIGCGYHGCYEAWQYEGPHQISYSEAYERAGADGWLIVRGKPVCPNHTEAGLEAMAKGYDDLLVMAARAGKVMP
jgi:hypothetical protein